MEQAYVLPSQITNEFLEACLHYPIESFEIQAGTNHGDNYMSILHAVTVSRKLNPSEKEYLIVKCFPNHPSRQEFLQKCNIFSKEVDIYTQWIPILQKFQQDVLKEDTIELPFAKCFKGQAINYFEVKNATDHLQNYLVFEDLRKTDGYKMADRIHGLDVDHCELVIKELAKIHSMSWAFKQKYGIQYLSEKYSFLKDTMLNEDMEEDFGKMNEAVVNQALGQISKGFPPESVEYLSVKDFLKKTDFVQFSKLFGNKTGIDERAVENHMRIKPSESEELNNDPWLFACHGDCWVNNYLFKYDSATGKPVKLKLVDLQICKEACPTTDLAYFIYTSTVGSVRKAHLDDLLHLYLNEFIRHCKMFDVLLPSGFNIATLRRRFNRSKIFGFYMAIYLLQVILRPPEQAKNMDESGANDMAELFGSMMGLDEEKTDSNTNIQGRFKEIVQELYAEGVI